MKSLICSLYPCKVLNFGWFVFLLVLSVLESFWPQLQKYANFWTLLSNLEIKCKLIKRITACLTDLGIQFTYGGSI